MEKKEIVFSDLKGHLLSPGNIFWKKNSGAEVLISKKGDFLNLDLVLKIQNSKQKILIENEIDQNFILEFKELINAFNRELLMAEKLKYREKIFEFLVTNFIQKNCTQFEMNQIFWMCFSKIDNSEMQNFLNRDRDIFLRSMTVASGVVFMALVNGYYKLDYLKKIFTETLITFKELSLRFSVVELKEKLEKYRLDKTHLDIELLNFHSVILESDFSNLTMFEKWMIELNDYYSYFENYENNILAILWERKFSFENNTYDYFYKTLNIEEKKIKVA